MRNLKFTDVRALVADCAFLIDDGKTSILYDTGFSFTGNKIVENIKKELGNRALDYVFLTHSHYDHALGVPAVKRAFPNCQIVASTHTAEIFKKEKALHVMRELDESFARICGVENYEDVT